MRNASSRLPAMRPPVARLSFNAIGLVVVAALTAHGGEVHLKNGVRIAGQVRPLQSLSAAAVNRGPTTLYPVVLIDAGWRRVFVPHRQVTADGLDLTAGMTAKGQRAPEIFNIDQRKRGSGLTVSQVGLMSFVDAWSEFGRRRVTLQSARGPIDIVQGITRIAPDHVWITSLTHDWQFGQSLASISPVTIEQILRRQIDAHEANDRLALARFFLEAEYYPQAFRELDAISTEFSGLSDRVSAIRTELAQLFGDQLMEELDRRRAAGQRQLTRSVARSLTGQSFGPAVAARVDQLLAELDADEQKIELIRLQLGELQAKLTKPEEIEQVAAIRVVLSEELSPAGLPRLQPFLQVLDDTGVDPEEKLALALSGWVVGSAGAVTELPTAIAFWELRRLAVEYLRSGDPSWLESLPRLEGVGPRTLLAAASRLPLPLEPASKATGEPFRVEVPTDGTGSNSIAYWVMLPPEYDPQVDYPCIVTLNPPERTPEEMTRFWGGSADQPGLAQRQGYIVVSPEHAAERTDAYRYDVGTHDRVLGAITHARRMYRIDSDRIYLSGHGLGGDASVDLALSHPSWFAGAIPVNATIDHYAKYYREQARYVSWYFVFGERASRPSGDPVFASNRSYFDGMFVDGANHDVICVEYPGRGTDLFPDELPRIFDWMALHRRPPPQVEFACRSLRRSDSRYFWLSAPDLPDFPNIMVPAGTRRTAAPVAIEGKITPGNTIYIKSPSRRHTLHLSDGQVSEESRVTVRLGDRQVFRDFVAPDPDSILGELRATGDRQRIAAYRIVVGD